MFKNYYISFYIFSHHFKESVITLLFHYTSQKGFEGIVKEDGIHLWFSDAMYLNDSNEIIDAKTYLDRAAKELFDEKQISEEVYNKILGIKYTPLKFDGIKTTTNKGSTFTFEVTSSNYDKYVCCFSKDSDSLPMWNYYLKNDENGFAVGLDFENLDSSNCTVTGSVVDHSCFNLSTTIETMVYNETEKIELFKSEILDYSKDYNNRTQPEKIVATVSFQQAFENLSLKFKDYHFAYENEARLISTVRNSGNNEIEGKKRDDIKFRLSHGLAIPYFELLIPNKEILKAISISPKIGLNTDNDSLTLAMKKYLRNLGYSHQIDINCSEIPLRYY